MAAPSYQDLFDTGRAEAVDRRPELTFSEGDISEFLVAGMAAMADSLVGYFAGRIKATFLDGASGDDLTALADDHWNIQRFEAQFATGTVDFTRTNGNGAPAGTIPAGFVIATQKDASGNEIQYTVNADLNFILNELGPKAANVTAILAGQGSNADLNTVNRLITTAFDSTFTVNNPSSKMAGGEDQESDEDLRERVRSFPATLRRGTLAAIEFGAKTVSGVRKASAVEEEDPLNPGLITGIVNLYVTDSDGNSSTPMIQAVEVEIINWKAAGTIVNVFGGVIVLQNISVTVTARVGTDTQALIANIQAAISARINKLKIGEDLSPDIIKQAVFNVDENILSVTVLNPAVTVVADPNEIIRPGIITVT